MPVAVRWVLRLLAALALIWFGTWLVSPKSQSIQAMCQNLPICPDPLVYLSNHERQPFQTGSATTNLRPGQTREVTVNFDLYGVPPTTPVNVLRVTRQWYSHQRSELTARPFQLEKAAMLYDDDDLTVTVDNIQFTKGTLTFKVSASKTAQPSSSVLIFTVQKQGTRWGGSGQAFVHVWVHAPDK